MQDTANNYLYTKSAQTLIDNIKVQNNSSLRKMIMQSADQEATILLNKFAFYRYFKEEDSLICGFFSIKDLYLTYETFRIREDDIIHPKGFIHEIEFFIKCLVFAKCTNTETELIHGLPGKKQRAKIDKEKYFNESGVDVILVNAKYNKIVIRDEPFYVNTHGRFQPCGKNREYVKYIIIEGYFKKGYKREYKNQ